MLSASGNLFKCHQEFLYLQPLIPPKRFDIFSPITGGCLEGLGVLWFFFKYRNPEISSNKLVRSEQLLLHVRVVLIILYCLSLEFCRCFSDTTSNHYSVAIIFPSSAADNVSD